ncbi:MAG: hypothetical protein HOJ35_00340, partial [Bdellovibrionales bacterium]|nr:hypothetical protein [Bdellovibrionales bacterium]
MKTKKLLHLIEKFTLSTSNIINNNFDNLEINLQNATPSTLVFYNLSRNEQAFELFEKRVKDKSYGAIIVNRDHPELKKFNNIIKVDNKNFLEVQRVISDVLFPIPKKLQIIGVTGTNGKTTTVSLANQIACNAGRKSIAIGTLGTETSNNQTQKTHATTTPSYIDLRKILFNSGSNLEFAFIEVSSHALEQNRLYDLKLDLAAWTNFTQDHLDYHKNMETYFNSKLKIFEIGRVDNFELLLPSSEGDLIDMIPNRLKSFIKVVENIPVLSNFPLFLQADYNKANLTLAYKLSEKLLIDVGTVDLTTLIPPTGRFQVFDYKKSKIIIDYAHSPDGLKQVLKTIKNVFPGFLIRVIFGCGGDRDSSKRKLMGEIADKYSDFAIITSDNPRSE